MRVNQFEDAAGVGKIAGKGQENDPRYKTSLTVDVHPDTVAKEIAAFFPTKPPKTGQHHIKETDMKKINEVNPHDYDSDEDYYAALRRKPRAASDDYDPPEPAPSAEDDFYDKQARDRERHKQQVQTTYSDHEGVAPNNEKYNGIYTIKAVDKATGENELYKWKNFHHGAKKVVDIKQVESKMPGGPVELTVYYVDNHKYGMWTPWKAEESRDPDHRFSNEVDGVDARVKQMAIHRARDMEEGTGEEFELAGVGVAYELGRRAYKQGQTIKDNPYSATREARKYDEWEKGLERGKWDAIEARRFRHSVGEQGVAEDYNPEYDDEAGMADNNLETLERAVDGIDELINAGDNLPEWCQEKIAVAKSMLVTVWDYMKSEENRGMSETSDQPTMRRVAHEKLSGNGEMVKVVTYEVLNSKGVTVKTGMSRETAASLVKHLKQQGK